MGALHRVSPREELRQPAEQRRLAVRGGRLRHGPDGERRGGPHRGHRRLAVSLLTRSKALSGTRALADSPPGPTRYEEDKKQWGGMLREMRYAAGSSCVSMRLNAARMPKL